ncbi:MAG: DinB family protein [Bellilinea sp.]
MSSLAEIKKKALLAEMVSTRQDILAAAAEIPAVLRFESFVGHWNVMDLLAHMTGWDDANRQAVDAVRSGQLPAFYQYAERNWVTFNDKLVAEYRSNDLDALSAGVRETQRQLIAVLEAVPADDFDRDFKVRFRKYKVTISRLLRAELQDEKQHLTQINRAAALTRGVKPKDANP